MNKINVKLCEITTRVIAIGFEGENNHTQVAFDCSPVFADYPNAVASLAVKPPVGSIYPRVVTKSGNEVLWDVSASDCANDGSGEYQLTFTNGEEIIKTWTGNMRVYASLLTNGNPPTPIEDWLEAANAVLGSLEDMTASASGLPAGSDPTAEMTDVGGHKNIALGIPAGAQGAPGQDGQDGVSPVITVTDITGGHRLTIVDAQGTHTVDVMNGTQGATGADGYSPTVAITDITGGHTVTITDKNGAHAFNVMDGTPGFSPVATVTKSGTTATISITDAQGTTTAQISDGNPAELIDDTTPAANKTFSSDKLNTELSGLKNAINVLDGSVVKSVNDSTPDENGNVDIDVSEYVPDAVEDWLDDHPEATTTVEDGAISYAKLNSDLKETVDDTAYISETFVCKRKVIKDATISSGGKINSATTNVDLVCYRVIEGTVISSTDTIGLYAFFTNEPELGDYSYNNSREVTTNLSNVVVPTGCKWIAIRIANTGTLSIIPTNGIIGTIDTIKDETNQFSIALECYKKWITNAYVNNSGIVTVTTDRSLVYFKVKPGTKITATGTYSQRYGFFANEPVVGSVTYNESATTGEDIEDVVVPAGCNWIGITVNKSDGNNITLSPQSLVIEDIKDELGKKVDSSDVVIELTPEWDQTMGISQYGSLGPVMNGSQVSTAIKISKPIPVRTGDVVSLTGKLSNRCNIAWTTQERINTYQGVPSYIPLSVGSSISERTETVTIERDGYIIVSAFHAVSCSVSIKRSYNSQQEENARISIDSQLRHNYVDTYDFVPNLEKKRTNSILTYQADDKKESNFMVNAVAYPNGEIIACRAGSGQVVKIANDGTETVLLTIANAQDWRGMFMDSNLNVYVSPHSAQFSPAISNTDRGLYKLEYGGNSFTKVIALCHDVYAVKWESNTAYTVGDVVFDNLTSIFYVCKTDHTSSTSIDLTKFNTIPAWAKNTAYAVGDLVKYRNIFYRCNYAHTSTTSMSTSRFDALTEFMNNDDTIWTMCEDANGNLYAGVYAHSLRDNPSIYMLANGGTKWFLNHNFIMCGTLPAETYSTAPQHVHCINYNDYDRKLYAAVGETNTIVCSTDRGFTWTDMHIPCVYGQPTYVMGVKDGLLIGSDGHYACGISKLSTDGKLLKRCGCTAPGFIFNIRRSDVTGWLYAFTRIDNVVGDVTKCPPVEAITDASALASWKADANTNPTYLAWWEDYNKWASVYYPEDAIRPQHSVMMVSRDEGETWEVFKTIECSQNYASICGFITVGYFRDGECLVGCLLPVDGTQNGMAFVQPFIVSEGKKKRTVNGFDLTGEIFIKTNSSNVVPYDA